MKVMIQTVKGGIGFYTNNDGPDYLSEFERCLKKRLPFRVTSDQDKYSINVENVVYIQVSKT